MAIGSMLSVAHARDMGVMIEDPWIREAPPAAGALAGYMTIRNHSPQARTLVGAESEAFGRIMLHRTVMRDGAASMVHLDKVELPHGADLAFEPGGRHLMLMQPERSLKMGDQVSIDLLFSDGNRESVVFTVRKDEGAAHGSSHSGHGH